MKRTIKKAVVGIMAASLIAGVAPLVTVNVQAATVTKGEYDFSNMTIRRVWFNTNDPVFLIDNYKRVWLDKNANVLATGDYKKTTADGDLMAPMKEMFAQIGGVYNESGDTITITMNGTTLGFTIGSKDVTIDGKKQEGVLSDAQVPTKVNVKEQFADFNTYLTEDYFVTYLPVAYVLNTFEADIYQDGNVQSFYAAIPIFNDVNVPSYETKAEGYGNRYDTFMDGALTDSYAVSQAIADNVVALQNEDGGFGVLPANLDMAQADVASKIGTLKQESTLENGSTVAQLRYLAQFITETNPQDSKYADAFAKGIDYLVKNQNANGGWSMSPTAAKGFNGNTVIGNQVTTEVLTLLSDMSMLNNQNYVFARRSMDMAPVEAAVAKGNDFLVLTQVENDGVKAGWASQVKSDGTVTMGRTYERESVNAETTKQVVEYLMTIHNPSSKVIDAVKGAAKWLEDVKIEGKETEIVHDTSMNNGFDIFLVDGDGTWAINYVYDADSKAYRPLYSDVTPTRADQKIVNQWDMFNYVYEGKKLDNVDNVDMIYYSTRTSVKYYDDTLAAKLLADSTTDPEYTTYKMWLAYLDNGFPEVPKDPEVPTDPTDPTDPENPTNPDDPSVKDPTTGDSSDGNVNSPQTGDYSNMFVYTAILAASLGMGGAVYYTNKKRIKKNNSEEK